MRILLVRHARTTNNTARLLDTAFPGAGLDEVGRVQAESLVERLGSVRVDDIVVSDLVRTAQTAAPLALARGLTPRILPGLREIPAGEDELSADWARYVGTLRSWREHPGRRIPGGENATEFLTRFDAAIGEVVASGYESVVAVSHGAALRSWTSFRVPGFAELLGTSGLPNTTVITIDGNVAGGWSLVSVEPPPGVDVP